MHNMFTGVTLSTPNYSNLLVGWSALALQPSVTFDAGNSKYYTGAPTAARQSIITNFGWTINDGGSEVSPLTVPGAPTGVNATAGNAQATVTFTAPASNGGSDITGYTVTSNPAAGTDTDAGTTNLTHTITGLTNGTPYTFTVTATNAIGTSAASAFSNSVTPAADTQPPTITITSPESDKTYFNTQKTLDITYTLTDNLDPNPRVTSMTLDDNPVTSPINLLNLPFGSHLLKIVAEDTAHNSTEVSAVFNLQAKPLAAFMVKNLSINWKPAASKRRPKADTFSLDGKLDLPSAYTPVSLTPDVTLILEVGTTEGTDTVLATTMKTRWNNRDKYWEYWDYKNNRWVRWQYSKRGKFEIPSGANLDIHKLTIKWAGKEGKMDTYSIAGDINVENDDSGIVNVTLVLPVKAGGELAGTEKISCKIKKQSWEYKAK